MGGIAPCLESQASSCSKTQLPHSCQGVCYLGEKSLVLVAEGVGVVGSPDWLGPGGGGVTIVSGPVPLLCLWVWSMGTSAFLGLGLKHR